jgi:hypothetical protein
MDSSAVLTDMYMRSGAYSCAVHYGQFCSTHWYVYEEWSLQLCCALWTVLQYLLICIWGVESTAVKPVLWVLCIMDSSAVLTDMYMRSGAYSCEACAVSAVHYRQFCSTYWYLYEEWSLQLWSLCCGCCALWTVLQYLLIRIWEVEPTAVKPVLYITAEQMSTNA